MHEHAKNFDKLVDLTTVKFAPTYFPSLFGLLGIFLCCEFVGAFFLLFSFAGKMCSLFRCSNSGGNFFLWSL